MKRTCLTLAQLLFVAFLFVNPSKLHAQGAVDNKTVKSSTEQLKLFAGKYLAEDNKMNFLQMIIKDNHLVLRQSWDGVEIDFKQTAELEFYNDDHSFPLKFTKSSTGKMTQVLAFNKDVWNRVDDNYKPELQKTIQLTPVQLKAFEGKYELKGGDGDEFLQITAANDHLVLKQLWDQREINFSPVSEVDFFNDVQTFPLKFTKGADGVATEVLAFNKDVWTKMK